jgi:hypothetical protein
MRFNNGQLADLGLYEGKNCPKIMKKRIFEYYDFFCKNLLILAKLINFWHKCFIIKKYLIAINFLATPL